MRIIKQLQARYNPVHSHNSAAWQKSLCPGHTLILRRILLWCLRKPGFHGLSSSSVGLSAHSVVPYIQGDYRLRQELWPLAKDKKTERDTQDKCIGARLSSHP